MQERGVRAGGGRAGAPCPGPARFSDPGDGGRAHVRVRPGGARVHAPRDADVAAAELVDVELRRHGQVGRQDPRRLELLPGLEEAVMARENPVVRSMALMPVSSS
jgi:hypothetical protein